MFEEYGREPKPSDTWFSIGFAALFVGSFGFCVTVFGMPNDVGQKIGVATLCICLAVCAVGVLVLIGGGIRKYFE